jgi:hypothetical protein
MTKRYFWGLILILIGLIFMLNNLGFSVDFGRVLVPFILIAIGISIMIKPAREDSGNRAIFDDSEIKITADHNKYDAVFGKGVFDFTDLKQPKENDYIDVNIVFGNGIIKINQTIPIKIIGVSAFATTRFPDDSSVAFGERAYTTKAFNKEKPYYLVKINTVFGSAEILD